MEDILEIQETQLQEPDPPIKKLYKGLYADKKYTKSFDEFRKQYSTPESIDKLYNGLKEDGDYTKDKTEFQKQYFSDTPQVKKKSSIDFGGSSLEAGNALSQSNGVGGGEIPKIEMYTLPNGEMIETDPVSVSKKYKELAGKKTQIMTGGEGAQIWVDDEAAQTSAKKIAEDFKGMDIEGIYEDTKGLSDDLIGLYKNDILPDRDSNNQLYQRKLSNIKWRSGFERKLLDDVDKGNIDPDNYNRIKHGIEQLPISTSQGDYTNQRSAIKSLAEDIRMYGGENKNELLKDFAVEVSKAYGNPDNKATETFKDSPESNYLTPDAQLGYQYLQDISPDRAEQYKRLFIDQKSLKDKPDEKRGYDHLMLTLEETGLGLKQNAVTEELNSLNKQAELNGGLSEEQIQRATKLEKVNEELSAKRNELDSKYPERIEDKVDDALQEIMGQKTSGMFGQDYLGGKAWLGIRNTAQGIWEAASTPFMSDQSNTMRELAIMGESLEDEKIYHKTDKNKSINYDTMVIQPELQKQIDEIKNNGLLTNDAKEQKLYRLLRDNTDKFGRVPIKGGKFNINPSSVMYGLTDLGTSLLPFVALEYATGGIGGAGTGAKFLRTFTAAAATTFHDEYANAIREGKPQSEAYKSAMSSTAINSLAMAGAGTPTEIRAMANGKTSAGKLINSMSDDAIQKVLDKGTPKGLKGIAQNIKERAKATPEMFKEGLKTGAKFEAYMAGANALNGREQDFKRSLVAIGEFGILGASLGQLGFKSPSQLQKSAGLEFGKKPDEYIAIAEAMKKDGQLNDAELSQRTELIKSYEEAYKSIPKNLDEKQQSEYLYQTVIKNEATKGKSNLPPRQAAEAEHTAMVADYKREIILDDTATEKLEKKRDTLEKQLEQKDKEGKLVLDDKERAKAKAEVDAINDTIKERTDVPKAPEIEGEPEKKTEPSILRTEQANEEGFYPEKITEPIELSVEPSKEIKNEAPKTVTTTEEVKVHQPSEVVSVAETKPIESVVTAEEGKTGEPFVEEKRTILSHRGLQEVATEFGFGDVTSREVKSDPQLFKDAQYTVDKWTEKGEYQQKMNGLVEKAENAEVLTDEQRVILQQHIANVRGEMEGMTDINTPEYNAKLTELNRLIRAGERTRSAAGAALRVPYMASVPNDLPTMLVEEMNISKVPELTEQQKATVQKEYSAISTVEKAYQQKVSALEAENAKLRAGRKVSETKSNTPRSKKTSEDFTKEREDIKKSITDKWNKAKNVGIVSDPKNDLLIQIAPDVAKLVKSYVEEGVSKLEDIVTKIHDELKGFIPDLKEKDVHDIIAGDYNKKRPTKSQIAEQIENIRLQAKLVNKLDELLSGIEPKNENKKVQRNAEIENLRQQIKDFKREKTEAEKTPKEKLSPDQQALKSLKTKMQKEAEDLKEQLRSGNYDKPEKKEPVKLDAEALKLRDELIKLRQNREVRLALQQRMNETGRQKGMRLAAEVLNVPRTLMTIGDYSGLLRQNIFFTLGHPKETAAAAKEMFKSGWSQTKYDRWFADLKEHPRYGVMQKTKLAITDSLNHDLTKREEDFMSSLSEKIPFLGKTLIKGSERSYTALLNQARVARFDEFAAALEDRGVTYENSPKVYDAMAEYINNATGRSDFGETLNRVAPILNSVFFSPRLIASRVNMLTYWMQPRFWKTLPREARVDYMRNWISLLGVGGSLMVLAQMGGADVEADPRSSDFGKIKSGNTRWDIWGGAQPYIRVVAQVATGQRKSTNTGKMYDLNGDDIFGETRAGVTTDFFRNKLAPVPGAAVDILSGRTGVGDRIMYQWGGAGEKEISLDQYVKQRLLPMTITGVQEAMKDQGIKAILTVGVPSTFGVGTQTYEKPPQKSNKPTKKPKTKKPEKK